LLQGDPLGAASGSLEQLGPGHKRHRELILFWQRINAIGYLGGLLLDQLDQDVGIKQIDHRLSRSCIGKAEAWL
jgi:hypothetical protein